MLLQSGEQAGQGVQLGLLPLRHGQSRTLEPVAAGSTLTVREADYTAEGYTTAREDGGTAQKPTILFTNTRQVEPPTGLWDESRPWRVMILLGLGLLGRVWETRRRRKGSC